MLKIFLCIIPIILGVLTHFYGRWVALKKKKDLVILTLEFRELLNKINTMSKDWESNSELILQSIQGLKQDIDGMKNEITGLKVEVGKLKVKSGMYGFIGGALMVIPSVLIMLLK